MVADDGVRPGSFRGAFDRLEMRRFPPEPFDIVPLNSSFDSGLARRCRSLSKFHRALAGYRYCRPSRPDGCECVSPSTTLIRSTEHRALRVPSGHATAGRYRRRPYLYNGHRAIRMDGEEAIHFTPIERFSEFGRLRLPISGRAASNVKLTMIATACSKENASFMAASLRLRRREDRGENSCVRLASPKISSKRLLHLFKCGVRFWRKQRLRSHDHSIRAVSTLSACSAI